MQELFIKTVQDIILNGYMENQDKVDIFRTIFGDTFFFGYVITDENCLDFFVDPMSGDTVLTVLSRLNFPVSLIDRLLEQAYRKLDRVLINGTDISRFLAFLAIKII